MDEGRWTTVTRTHYDHEREALEHVRALLPDAEPYRAWSNFTFTAETGHVYEVDLLVATRSGLYLIEIKSLNGRLTNSGANWILSHGNSARTRTFDNPLHLADAKAKRLKSLLQREATKRGVRERIPFLQAAVFLSVPTLQLGLADHQLHWVFGPEPSVGPNPNGLPGIWSGLLGTNPTDAGKALTPSLSKQLPDLLKGVGISKSHAHLKVGSWKMAARPFDAGPTWQDHLAEHTQLPAEKRRIRIYLVERNAAREDRTSIERAAKREMLALHGIDHPGIVQVDTLEPHEAGPALIFRHDPRSLRLDHYMAQYGAQLSQATRLGLIRQLADAVAYAHRRHLHHRALSARGILVTPASRRDTPEATDTETAWLKPTLRISDWQAATRGPDSVGGSGAANAQISATGHAANHLEPSAHPYLAPEFTNPEADPVRLDVFGLGALTYLLLTGQPPAASRAELLNRLSAEGGLRPSTVDDTVTETMDELAYWATPPVWDERLASVADFLEILDEVEHELTAPRAESDSVHPEPEESSDDDEPDPLEAKQNDTVGGEWIIDKRLGTGSTCRAFLAMNAETGAMEVLKIGLSDEKASRLEHEASVLRGLILDSRVIHLARPEPLRIGGRTVLVLEHAGEKTLARQIRDEGRLAVDELETYSDYLFGAMDFLEGEGVTHRDIKPDNIAIRIRPNRTKQLVLFDFSLAGISVKELEAGTPRYLDPFLGEPQRMVYDEYAERYALAVTLHEMASGELPVWEDGVTEPRFTTVESPTLAVEAFDSAIADGLTGFFARALHRDARKRFESLKQMRAAWNQVFHAADEKRPVSSRQPVIAEDETAQESRNAAAAAVTSLGVTLEAAGLSERAKSAAYRLDASTVGDLLALPSKSILSLAGVGAKTRQELQQRIKEWRERLHQRELPTAGEPAVAAVDGALFDASSMGLNEIAKILVPELAKNKRNETEVKATRLLLGLPDPGTGDLPSLGAWPVQPKVAAVVDVTPGRIAQVLTKQRKRWHELPEVRSLHAEVVALLEDNGRVMGWLELADALLAHRGSTYHGERLRRAVAMAALRAAVETDSLYDEPRLLPRRHDAGAASDRILIALEVCEDDGPDTPAAPALLDYADELGKAVDTRLTDVDPLPTPAAVLRELSAVSTARLGAEAWLDERRLVHLAAAASTGAAATSRLEIYPRALKPVRALRLAQAGVIPIGQDPSGRPIGLTPEQIRDRVRSRFPALPPMPDHPGLDRLLDQAGFEVVWDRDRYIAPRTPGSSSGAMYRTNRLSGHLGAAAWASSSPDKALAARTEQRLLGAADEGGFRALTVRLALADKARRTLLSRFGAEPLNVAKLFLDAFHEVIASRTKPTWDTILKADASTDERAVRNLAAKVREAWEVAEPRLAGARSGLLLLHDAGPLGRYDGMHLLESLANESRHGGRPVWVLCPVDDSSQFPTLDGVLVRTITENERIALPDSWVADMHHDRNTVEDEGNAVS
ncbi:BREX system serine/threonine kinase PglW [Uniformispora flossi]|uniref:BREX system serine/threonine kinase PglW n=1 Tax=Uniformispora flossi TaxID=3390723 RepID=UPI003C30BF88